ncbi:cache domain-containing protein [Oceanimonas sp. NS1]|nr:cache domain-containing protein [Oceanimonas sp. NS1]
MYEIKPGHSELMTSVTVPIIAEGRFRGVSGADIHLSAFQQQIMQLADSLYHGQAEALLLSSQGMVVASSRQPDSLGRPLSEVMEGNASQRLLALSGGEVSTLGDDYLYGVYQMPITAAGVNWSLLIRVPREVALADVALLQQHLTAGVRELTHQQWLAGGLIMIAGIGAMVLLVRTITRPLTLMNERIGSLNSAEGT